MKNKFTFVLTLLFCLGCNVLQSQNNTECMENGWYDKAVESVQIIERSFYSESGGTGYRVTNSANGLNFHINNGGYKVRNVSYNNDNFNWECEFLILGIGKGKALLNNQVESVSANKTLLQYSGSSFNTEYVNGEEGLRQNFIVKARPEGVEQLSIYIALKTNLRVVVFPGEVVLQDPLSGKSLLHYDKLKVWDAKGQQLHAVFKSEGNKLEIQVEDKNAEYPITVDPLNHSSAWDVSAPGLLSSLPLINVNSNLLGYKMAMVGDVNNDGFNDAAIGAPGLVDIITGSGSLASVGGVFVFHGSATGLSIVPDNVLQPTGLIAGSLFGYSIASGKLVGNDNYNDLVIGAPMDQVSIQILLTTYNGNVGKAYVFSGAGMTASNPSPSLSLKLDLSCLNALNITNKALFGFSVSVAEDANADGKPEIVVGAPLYQGLNLLDVQTGGAFVYYSNGSNTYTSFSSFDPPDFSLLGIAIPGVNSIAGLLFGYSLDGLGDFNGDGKPDIAVGAPAGVNLSSLTGVLTGQVLGGQVYVYYGKTTNNGYNTNIGAELHAASGGLLGNAANLFGFELRGLRSVAGSRNGGLVVGAPIGGLVPNLLGLTIQTGNMHVFKPRTGSPLGVVTADQVIESPRSNSVLSILNTLNVNLLFGTSIDNMYDVNCDGYPDLVAGEPLSSGTSLPLIQVNAVGGAAHVYLGDGTGLFNSTPVYSAEATYGTEFMSVNAAALFGYSVAGGYNILGANTEPVMLVGSPSGALDFGAGLLNLGATLSTLFDFAAGDNGPGKSYGFNLGTCLTPLARQLVMFAGSQENRQVLLNWQINDERYVHHYVVEKSSDGKTWFTLGAIKALKNQSNARYNLPDFTPYYKVNYYKLIAVKEDGTPAYEKIIRLHIVSAKGQGQGQGQLSVYPNPANDKLEINTRLEGELNLSLYSLTGQLLYERSFNGTGLLLNRSEAGNLPEGVYLVRVSNERGEEEHCRVSLLKQ